MKQIRGERLREWTVSPASLRTLYDQRRRRWRRELPMALARGLMVGGMFGALPFLALHLLGFSPLLLPPLRFFLVLAAIFTAFIALLSWLGWTAVPREMSFNLAPDSIRRGPQKVRWSTVTGLTRPTEGVLWLLGRSRPPFLVVLTEEQDPGDFVSRHLPAVPTFDTPQDRDPLEPPSGLSGGALAWVYLLTFPLALVVAWLLFRGWSPLLPPKWLLAGLVLVAPGTVVVGLRSPALLVRNSTTQLATLLLNLPFVFLALAFLSVFLVRLPSR